MKICDFQFLALFSVSILVLVPTGMAQEKEDPKPLVRQSSNVGDHRSFHGTWELVEWSSRSPLGLTYPFGKDAKGMISYDERGNMSVHLMRADRPTFKSDDLGIVQGPEIDSAFRSYVAYFGTYSVDHRAATVTHHLKGCTFPNWTGSGQVRHFTFENGLLILSTPPIVEDSVAKTHRLIWRPADANDEE